MSGGSRRDAADGAEHAPPPEDGTLPVPVTVNGEPRELPSGTTVADLLRAVDARLDRCAVEVNREIVPRSTHAARALRAGDVVEIVTFVGGG